MSKHEAHGLCNRHYKRLRTFGDALAPVRYHAEYGEPIAWIEAHKDYEGDDCIPWPFCKTKYGYGTVKKDGRMQGVHCVMCEYRHGPPPTPKHEAAHNCGKGHLSCVNPNHIRWATRSQNHMDKVKHGTHSRGERSPVAKLTQKDICAIRASKGVTQDVLAEKFGVRQPTISNIKSGKSWKWLKPSQESANV